MELCTGKLPHGKFFMLLCRLLIFSKSTFSKKFLGIQSECRTVWIQMSSDILSCLILVHTVCKSYQQPTLGCKEYSIKLFACLVCCRLQTFFRIFWGKNPFRNTIGVSNSLEPDQNLIWVQTVCKCFQQTT